MERELLVSSDFSFFSFSRLFLLLFLFSLDNSSPFPRVVLVLCKCVDIQDQEERVKDMKQANVQQCRCVTAQSLWVALQNPRIIILCRVSKTVSARKRAASKTADVVA